MDNLFIIKDRIIEALKLREMTASDLAKKIGISPFRAFKLSVRKHIKSTYKSTYS